MLLVVIKRGEQLSGYECCRNVEPFLATLDGVCWLFRNQSSQLENAYTTGRGLRLTFQISRNQFQSNSQNFHPGIELYLQPQQERDRLRVATELQSPLLLSNKKSRRVLIQKEVVTNLDRRGECGQSPGEALAIDRAVENSTYVPCVVEAAALACGCMPLVAVLWALQGDI